MLLIVVADDVMSYIFATDNHNYLRSTFAAGLEWILKQKCVLNKLVIFIESSHFMFNHYCSFHRELRAQNEVGSINVVQALNKTNKNIANEYMRIISSVDRQKRSCTSVELQTNYTVIECQLL